MRFISMALAAAFVVFPSIVFAQDCDPWQIKVTTTPSPAQSAEFVELTEKLLSDVPKKVDVLIVGDSIARRWPADMLEPLFPGKKIWNFGVGSDRIQNILQRMGDPRLYAINPEKVVLFAGGNNIGNGDKACAVAAGIDKVVDLIHQLWPNAHVYLLTVPPRGIDFKSNQNQQKALNAALVLNPNFTTLQINEDKLTCGGILAPIDVSEVNRCVEGDLWKCDNYEKDYVHLTRGGYDIIAAAFN
jgi:lysophospholipase L1-like esterase